jgi:thioredoxin-related protein
MDKPFQLLTIDIQESRKNVEAFARKNNLNFPVLLDSDGKVSEMYGVSSTPMKILVDKNGNMIGAALGYRSWDKAEVRDLITLLMDADQAG